MNRWLVALAVLLMPSAAAAAGAEGKQGTFQTFRVSGQATQTGTFAIPVLTAGATGWVLLWTCMQSGNPNPAHNTLISSTFGHLPTPSTTGCDPVTIVLPPGDVLSCQTYYDSVPVQPLTCLVTGLLPDVWSP